jgi:nucleoside-diphosphate-sugar epimerase
MKLIAQGQSVVVITDNSRHSVANAKLPLNTFQEMSWRQALNCRITAESTFIGWRVPPQGRTLGDEIISWIKSTNFNTEKISHLSSASVYSGNREKFSETDYDSQNKGVFMNSKQALENLVCDISFEKGTKFVNYRISNVYGKGLTQGFINESIQNMNDKKPITVYKGLDLVRDFLLIDDLVYAILQLWEHEESVSTLNISTGRGVSISEIVSQLIAQGNKDLEIHNVEAPEGLKLNSVLSCKRLEQMIPWKPKNLDETIRNLVLSSS